MGRFERQVCVWGRPPLAPPASGRGNVLAACILPHTMALPDVGEFKNQISGTWHYNGSGPIIRSARTTRSNVAASTRPVALAASRSRAVPLRVFGDAGRFFIPDFGHQRGHQHQRAFDEFGNSFAVRLQLGDGPAG